MIYKWLITFTLLVFGIFFLASATWFEREQLQIEQINEEHRQTIQELRNIKQTTQWLKDVVIPYFSTMPLTKHDAELDMIRFYDQYAQRYHLKVSKFIYYDSSAKMDIGFSFIPKNGNDIDQFLALKYPKGFTQIQVLTLKDGVMSGVMTIIQPMQGAIDASRE